MKKRIFFKGLFIASILLNLLCVGYAFNYLYNNKGIKKYFKHDVHASFVTDSCKVVFMGNSITANWMNLSPHFFGSNDYICRGVGGNTSSQILLRFQQDVVSNRPKLVVINAGINDIGFGDGFYDPKYTFDNIKSMVDIAKANNIEVILTSLLPCDKIDIRLRKIDDVVQKVLLLNKDIEKYASANNIPFVDYHAALKDGNNAFNPLYNFDGVHPNAKGYEIMESLVKPKIDSILQTKQIDK